MLGLGLGGHGIGTQALALHRYKAKTNQPPCHITFLT